jgi:hypothetical protein
MNGIIKTVKKLFQNVKYEGCRSTAAARLTYDLTVFVSKILNSGEIADARRILVGSQRFIFDRMQ